MNKQQYFLALNGQAAGPFTFDQVKQLYAAGTVTAETMYCLPESSEWLPLRNLFPEQAASAFQLRRVEKPIPAPPLIPVPVYAPPPARPAMSVSWGQLICLDCGSIGRPKKLTQGSFVVEVALWLLFCAPGIIYSLWRICCKRRVCSVCQSARIIPPGSPQGRAILERRTF